MKAILALMFILTATITQAQMDSLKQNNYTLYNTTSPQRIFDQLIDVKKGEQYYFEWTFSIKEMSASTGYFGISLEGSASFANLWIHAEAYKGNKITHSYFNVLSQRISEINTLTNGEAHINGRLQVKESGSLEPKIFLGHNPAPAVITKAKFKIWRLE